MVARKVKALVKVLDDLEKARMADYDMNISNGITDYDYDYDYIEQAILNLIHKATKEYKNVNLKLEYK